MVHSATNLKDKNKYAVKVVENASLNDEENLEALETEVLVVHRSACVRLCPSTDALSSLASP